VFSPASNGSENTLKALSAHVLRGFFVFPNPLTSPKRHVPDSMDSLQRRDGLVTPLFQAGNGPHHVDHVG
jgi:hypothetical protein